MFDVKFGFGISKSYPGTISEVMQVDESNDGYFFWIFRFFCMVSEYVFHFLVGIAGSGVDRKFRESARIKFPQFCPNSTQGRPNMFKNLDNT